MNLTHFIVENAPTIASIGGTLLTLLLVYLMDKSSRTRTKILEKELAKAKENETYTICPHCGKNIHFSEMSFYLPGGVLDNNLNGTPDDDER